MDQPVDGRLYTSTEARRAAAVSPRQINYWDQTGVLKPTRPAQGSGSVRGYTADEILALAALGRLTGDTDTPHPGGALPAGVQAAIAARGEFIAVVPGYRQRVVAIRDAAELLLMVRSEPAVTVLALGPLRAQVRQALNVYQDDMVGIH